MLLIPSELQCYWLTRHRSNWEFIVSRLLPVAPAFARYLGWHLSVSSAESLSIFCYAEEARLVYAYAYAGVSTSPIYAGVIVDDSAPF